MKIKKLFAGMILSSPLIGLFCVLFFYGDEKTRLVAKAITIAVVIVFALIGLWSWALGQFEN